MVQRIVEHVVLDLDGKAAGDILDIDQVLTVDELMDMESVATDSEL